MAGIRTQEYLEAEKDRIRSIIKNNEYVLVTDGGGDNTAQSKPVGLAFLVFKNAKLIYFESAICVDEINTTNKAEVLAVYEGVMWLRQNESAKKIVLLSDSKFVTDYCANRKWAVNYNGTQKNYYPAYVMLRRAMIGIDLNPIWIPRELNRKADSLASKRGEGVRKVQTEKVVENAEELCF